MELFLREAFLLALGFLLLFLACKIVFGTYFALRRRYIGQVITDLSNKEPNQWQSKPESFPTSRVTKN
jgi:hypothetical protein